MKACLTNGKPTVEQDQNAENCDAVNQEATEVTEKAKAAQITVRDDYFSAHHELFILCY